MAGKRRLSRSVEPELLTPAQFLALPAQPDGTIVRVLADAAAGLVWTLRFRAASASAHKWEVVGASQMGAMTLANVATASATAISATGGPSLIPPLSGEYEVAMGALMNPSAAGVVESMVLFNGNTDLGWLAADAASTSSPASGATSAFAHGLLTIVGGTVYECRYRVSGTGTGNWSQRFLGLRPVRVTGP